MMYRRSHWLEQHVKRLNFMFVAKHGTQAFTRRWQPCNLLGGHELPFTHAVGERDAAPSGTAIAIVTRTKPHYATAWRSSGARLATWCLGEPVDATRASARGVD